MPRKERKPLANDDLSEEIESWIPVTPSVPPLEESQGCYRDRFGHFRPFQEPGTSWVEFETQEPWTVAYGFVAREGALELAEIHIVPTSPGAERDWNFMNRGRRPNERGNDLAILPPGGLRIGQARELIGHLNEAVKVVLSAVPAPDEHLADAGYVTADRRPNRPPAAPLIQSEYKVALAALFYVKGRKKAVPTGSYVAEQLTLCGFGCAPRSVGNLISSARGRGFLTPTQQGRGGGQLTDDGRAIARQWYQTRGRPETTKRTPL